MGRHYVGYFIQLMSKAPKVTLRWVGLLLVTSKARVSEPIVSSMADEAQALVSGSSDGVFDASANRSS